MIKEDIKLETTVETRGNVTEPCPAPKSPPLSLPSSSLHDACTGLLPQKSLSRGKSMGLRGRKLPGSGSLSNSSKKGK